MFLRLTDTALIKKLVSFFNLFAFFIKQVSQKCGQIQ